MDQKILEKLQTIISEMSVNQLENIHPEQLFDQLEISLSDGNRLLNDLFKERLIAYKYRIDCLCGNRGTIYTRKMGREPYVCSQCGQEFSEKEVERKGTLLVEIDKEELTNFSKEEASIRINLDDKIVDLMEIQKNNNEEENKMDIFIGSSVESIKDMENIGYTLEQLGRNIKVLTWNQKGEGLFAPGMNTIDSLIKITRRVQAGIFIFGEDDKEWGENAMDKNATVRDNVLFEYGLFCGALGKSKVCVVRKGKPKIASDLNGVTYINGDEGELTIKRSLQDWLDEMK